MSHSTIAAAPSKPRAKLPLTQRADGRWCKKVRGKIYYFTGPLEEAVAEWHRVKDAILAGEELPPADATAGLTISQLCNQFLHSKAAERDEGKLSPNTWFDYESTAKRLVACWGKHKVVANLTPADFRRLRSRLAKTCNLTTLLGMIVKIRVIFNFGLADRLIDRSPYYGSAFDIPDAKARRIHRTRQEAAIGKKMYDAADVRHLIDAADVHLRAMILLAINCGFGNSDCGTLQRRSLDLKGRWVEHARMKTGINRRCPLWPETLKALKASLAKRPTNAKSGEINKLVFVTKYGASWSKLTDDNPVAKGFTKLLKALNLEQTGRGFYALRHTFRTVARHARDLDAVRTIMGHVNAHVETAYEHEPVEDDRLQAVVNHVRAWLFAGRKKKGLTTRTADA